jgi:DNA-binding transcriptional regulator YiaG
MTKIEFRAALKALGLSQSKFSERMGVRPNTVSTWASGAAAVPGPVRAYLELALAVRSLPV